jgi:uncharacterized membrane protein
MPTPATTRLAILVVGSILLWLVLSRFWSGEINAVDFTVYYDRPTYQTSQGRLMYVESADDPLRANQTYLSVHAHWIMIPLALFYIIYPSPLWLLLLSVVAVSAGALYIWRILLTLGFGSLVATAASLAFLLNDNTARTLNYGFHTEVLYAWFVPWAIHAALRRRAWSFGIATLGCVSVKEDAFMVLGAVSVSLALVQFNTMSARDRLLFLVMPPLVGLLHLVAYYTYLLPLLRPGGSPFYANYWGSFGRTPLDAAIGMIADPWRVFATAATSGFFPRVLLPHLWLPVLGWRWLLGVAPIVLLYGASDNEQMRGFGIYYAIVLVPFLVLGAAAGALVIVQPLGVDRRIRQTVAAGLIVFGSLCGGFTSGGYSLRPWNQAIAETPDAIRRLSQEESRVLVQSGLYPHAGYDARVQLLTPQALADDSNIGAIMVLAPSVSAWPLLADDLSRLAQSSKPVDIGKAESGLVLVRLGKSESLEPGREAVNAFQP